jgi:tRNA (cytosine38-C5)-methyltransferase
MKVIPYEINLHALKAYNHVFEEKAMAKNIEFLAPSDIDKLMEGGKKVIWSMSPPCQPHTRQGFKLDEKDNRSKPFLKVLEFLREVERKPDLIILENVKNFEVSVSFDMLKEVLDLCEYSFSQYLLSPVKYGIPNARTRFYLIATL